MNELHFQILMQIFWVLVYIGSSLWVFFDARKIKLATGNEKVRPLFWLLACLAFWIAAFPIYIYYRFKK